MELGECIHGARYENTSYRHRASSSYQLLAVADAGNSAPDNDERTTVAFLH